MIEIVAWSALAIVIILALWGYHDATKPTTRVNVKPDGYAEPIYIKTVLEIEQEHALKEAHYQARRTEKALAEMELLSAELKRGRREQEFVEQGTDISAGTESEPVPFVTPSLGLLPVELRTIVDSTGTNLNVCESVQIDLEKVPNWLIAGATGTGKSNIINVFLAQLVRRDPEQLRIAMIDPKRVELAPWSHIPHLWGDVARTIGEVAQLLDNLVAEMEGRYRMMEGAGLRNISGQAPRIVVIIDELAYLMLQDKARLEPNLIQLAQLGRAAGIHLIAATQRPSADIITGALKASLPGRIALRVANGVDSRVILDRTGAEALTGPGEVIVAGPVESETGKVPYLSDDEVLRLSGH